MRAALRIALPLALLAVVWHVADGPAAMAALLRADAGWLAAGLTLLVAQTGLSAARWRLTARGLGLHLPPGKATREYFVAQTINQTLPGGVLGDAARAVRVRGAAGIGPAAGSVVVERLAGQIALFAALGVGLVVAPDAVDLPQGVRLGLLAGLGLAALVLGILAAVRGAGWRGVTGRALRAGLLARRQWPGQVALGLAILACNIGAFACAARATGTALDPGTALIAVPLILSAMLLPLSIGGWGWREGAAAALFPLAGQSAAAGLAASAGFGALVLVAALPGALWLARAAPTPTSSS